MKKDTVVSISYWLAIGMLALTYWSNLNIDVMEIDAAQYASISREMADNSSFLEVYHRGEDYLDKPPLLFWLSAVSFKVFGVHSWSYKLPALLVLLLGLFATYRFTQLWYSKSTAQLATIMLASCQALIQMTNDVRTDGLLLGFTMLVLWQASIYLKHGGWKPILISSLGIALAMMSKGPLGLVFPAVAVGGHLLLRREWSKIFDYKWLVMLLVTAVCLIPMCYGLYQQFDLHPEKEVYGLQGPSGIEFFFWTQSFGRITGDNYWDNDSPWYYFFTTMLWDFQPWIFLFIPAFIWMLLKLVREKFQFSEEQEGMTLIGFLLMFFALSMSNYKLPHYVFPLFPLASIITANWIYTSLLSKQRGIGNWSWVQFIFTQLLLLLVLFAVVYLFPLAAWFTWMFIVAAVALIWMLFIKGDGVSRLILPSILISALIGMISSTHIYPRLLDYQSQSKAGKWITKHNVPEGMAFWHRKHGHSLDFYGERIFPSFWVEHIGQLPNGAYIYTDPEGVQDLQKRFPRHFKIVETFPQFQVSRINMKFINPKTRDEAVGETYLLEYQSD
jgi:4-amino-4-deoxy-L-arabinose transferase-like glycosyltransferase